MSNAPIPYHGEQPYSDAPEAYDPNQHNQHLSGAGISPETAYSGPKRQSSIVSPNSPPPQYPSPDGQQHQYPAQNDLQTDNRYSTYKGVFMPVAQPVPQSMGDVENQNQTAYAGASGAGVATIGEKKRFKDRRVFGIPMLWFLALISLIIIAGAVGGGVGSALGSKKKDNKPAELTVVDPGDGGIENPETAPIPEEPTGEKDPSGNGTTTDPDAVKPTKKVPMGILKPRDDSWYYMKNPFGKQNQELGLEVFVFENTPYFTVSEPRGDLWEHWGFWPASRNSTRAKDYQERLNITSELYILYNRGLVQRANSTSPTKEAVNDQQGWWWIEENPNGGVYIKGGLYGPDYALTVLDVGEETDEDIYRFEANWNRTEKTGGRERFVDGQIWQIELAFAFLEGEKGIWDIPAKTATPTAASAIATKTKGYGE